MKKSFLILLLLLLTELAFGQFKPKLITEADIAKFIALPNILQRLQLLDEKQQQELLAKEGLGTEESEYIISKIGFNYTWMYLITVDNSTGATVDNITKEREAFFAANPQYKLTGQERSLIEKHKDALGDTMRKFDFGE
ncbi:MAG: hypothetical protein LBP51_03875 [Deferribacteraceae bacterium]|jgi:hypothetical protein|nr:hypothetical protein [Deferribacteraceae bacterium]